MIRQPIVPNGATFIFAPKARRITQNKHQRSGKYPMKISTNLRISWEMPPRGVGTNLILYTPGL